MILQQLRFVCLGLMALFVLVALASCEHGDLSFDQSSGTFRWPIGDGSHESP